MTAPNDAKQEQLLAEWYTEAQEHFFLDEWAEAVRVLKQIVAAQPDYKDAPRMLQEAQEKLTDIQRAQEERARQEAERAKPEPTPAPPKPQPAAPKKTAAPAAKPAAAPIWKSPLVIGGVVVIGILIIGGLALSGGMFADPTPTPRPPTSTPMPTMLPITPDVKTIGGAEMVSVPAGEFIMGSENGDDDEKPVHTVYLDAYWIDRYEVTNAQYRECLDAGVCREPEYWNDDTYNAPLQPVVGVDWEQARTYCEWVGKRLPTEAEWEKAARGTDARKYPWGNSPADCDKAQYAGCDGNTVPVGSKPAGASPYGAEDMAGNVWEWTADWYDSDYYAGSPDRNPTGPSDGSSKVIRGGSWSNSDISVRSAYRSLKFIPTSTYDGVGLRCLQ